MKNKMIAMAIAFSILMGVNSRPSNALILAFLPAAGGGAWFLAVPALLDILVIAPGEGINVGGGEFDFDRWNGGTWTFVVLEALGIALDEKSPNGVTTKPLVQNSESLVTDFNYSPVQAEIIAREAKAIDEELKAPLKVAIDRNTRKALMKAERETNSALIESAEHEMVRSIQDQVSNGMAQSSGKSFTLSGITAVHILETLGYSVRSNPSTF